MYIFSRDFRVDNLQIKKLTAPPRVVSLSVDYDKFIDFTKTFNL